MSTPDRAYGPPGRPAAPSGQQPSVAATSVGGSPARGARPAPSPQRPSQPSGVAATTAPPQVSSPRAADPRPAAAPAARPAAAAAVNGGPRKVRLTLAKVDPWSVMKLGFLLSVAVGIAFVVLVAVLWMILDGMGVFTDIDRTVGTVMGSTSGTEFDLMNYIGFGRVLSLATVIGVIDVFLLTALTTLAGFLYNVCASLVGGIQLTLTDD